MKNKKCKYYPCHNMIDQDCKYCFCPLYPCLDDKLGDYVYINGTIQLGKDGKQLWDCSSCTLLHTLKNTVKLVKLIRK